MKRALFALMLFAAPIFAQEGEVRVAPVIAPTTIATIVTKAGNDTIWSAAKAFGSVAVGQQVYGPGLPFYCTVKSLPNPALDSAIVLSDTCNASATVSLQFGYFTSAQVTTGDWMGLPFLIRSTTQGGVGVIGSVEVVDTSDILDAFDIMYMNGGTGNTGLDNAAATLSVASGAYVLGYQSFTTITDLGSVRIAQDNDTRLIFARGGPIYGRLVAKSSMTPKSISSIYIRFRFIQ